MVSHRMQMFYVAIARFPKVFPGEAAVCAVPGCTALVAPNAFATGFLPHLSS